MLPCFWGILSATNTSTELITLLPLFIIFAIGSIVMRSAGCIVNDILDKDFDSKVFRTKDRPIASGKVSIKLAIFYSITLCLLALFVLLNFNSLTIIMALGSMPLAFTYPLMKRFTYWPQLFLGITFNYGLILGWTSITGKIDLVPIIFYLGAIFWTLGYDTIYGYQDIKDDEIIGLKSTSIKFKNKPKYFLVTCYTSLLTLFTIGGYYMKFHYSYFVLLILPMLHLFLYQIKTFNTDNPKSCLTVFKSNNMLGLIIFLNILITKNL